MSAKKQGQHKHAARRAEERYGLHYNKAVRQSLIGKIQSNNGKFVEKKTNRITIWLVEHEGAEYMVAYDKIRKNIATFLPLNNG